MLSVCLIALIVAAHTVFAFHFHRHQVDAQYVDQIVFQAAELERQILWNDRISTTRLLESVIAADDCVAYAFVELGGRPYAHTFASGIPRTLLGTPSSSEVVDRHFRDENGLGFHEMFVRVGDTDAVLHVGHSTNRASREAIRLLGRIFGIGIAAALEQAGLAPDFIVANEFRMRDGAVEAFEFDLTDNKWEVLDAFLDARGVDPRHVMYIGDSRPDEECFRNVGLPVASFFATPAGKHRMARTCRAYVPHDRAAFERHIDAALDGQTG